MSNIVNLKYDERFGNVFISLYPKPQDYKNSVRESINKDIKPPKVNETFEINDSRFLDEFPELIGLMNSFQTPPRNITARIDRGNNRLDIVGKTQDGDPISVVENLTYANNSGTYRAIDNSELGNVKFSVSKQNVERLSPFFSTTLTIDGVNGNGTITNVSFGKLEPLFVFDRNVIEVPLIKEGTFGDIPFERVSMEPDFDQGLVNDTKNYRLVRVCEEDLDIRERKIINNKSIKEYKEDMYFLPESFGFDNFNLLQLTTIMRLSNEDIDEIKKYIVNKYVHKYI